MDFFILGNPRSGTTMLRLMLNSHSLIGVPPESGFIQWWYSKYLCWSVSDTNNRRTLDAFLHDILSSTKIENWKLSKKELIEYILLNQPKFYSELIDCIYKFYTRNKCLIGDKNNYYIHHLDILSTIFPRAKFIHIIRDGRDIANSYRNINKLDQNLKYLPKFSSNIKDIANEWRDNLDKIEKHISKHQSISIRYEDLISDSIQTLTKICQFLDVRFENQMLEFYLHNDEPQSTLFWKGKTKGKVDENNKKNYLSGLTTQDVLIFNEIANDTLIKYNYV